MKTIIAGGRDLPEDEAFWEALDAARTTLGITEVVCGGARGGDNIGRRWAIDRGIPVKVLPADWKLYGGRAGPIRNQAMADYAQALVALPGGKGTADMVARAQGKMRIILIVRGGARASSVERAQRRGMKVIEVKG